MYIPTQFNQTDSAEIKRLIAEFPLAAIVTQADGRMTANHIPLVLEGEPVVGGRLIGHTAKGNAVWRAAETGGEVLVIFQGPSAYITPSWYPTKQETHEVVPTYNYAAVHVTGTLSASHDDAVKRHAVELLTNAMERERAEPWRLTDAPADYVQRMLQGIVAISVRIRAIEAKWKVSQNRPQADQAGVVEGLLSDSRDSQAALMSHMVQGGIKP